MHHNSSWGRAYIDRSEDVLFHVTIYPGYPAKPQGGADVDANVSINLLINEKCIV